jgi:hypothetical protein
MIERMPHHMTVEVAPLAGVDLDRGSTRRADAVSVLTGLLIAFDHGNREFGTDHLERAAQQRRLARAGARHEIERENALRGEAVAIGTGVTGILAQDIGFQPISRASHPGTDTPAGPAP